MRNVDQFSSCGMSQIITANRFGAIHGLNQSLNESTDSDVIRTDLECATERRGWDLNHIDSSVLPSFRYCRTEYNFL